jgi:hypothetical protein
MIERPLRVVGHAFQVARQAGRRVLASQRKPGGRTPRTERGEPRLVGRMARLSDWVSSIADGMFLVYSDARGQGVTGTLH